MSFAESLKLMSIISDVCRDLIPLLIALSDANLQEYSGILDLNRAF